MKRNLIEAPNIWTSYGYGEGFVISPAPSSIFSIPYGPRLYYRGSHWNILIYGSLGLLVASTVCPLDETILEAKPVSESSNIP